MKLLKILIEMDRKFEMNCGIHCDTPEIRERLEKIGYKLNSVLRVALLLPTVKLQSIIHMKMILWKVCIMIVVPMWICFSLLQH